MGFRLNYILDALNKIKNGLDLEGLKNHETEIIKKDLISIKGVGDKVSDCVLLFAYGRREIFPIDTWYRKKFFLIIKRRILKKYMSSQKIILEIWQDMHSSICFIIFVAKNFKNRFA